MKDKFSFLKKGIFRKIPYKKIDWVLKPEQVAFFEKMNDITLPDDYKYFVTHIANGIFLRKNGAGKKYKTVLGIDRRILETKIPCLASDFPFENDVEDSNLRYDSKHFCYDGAYPIYYPGCTYMCYLIVSGKCKGEVWESNDRGGFRRVKNNFAEFLEYISQDDCRL